MKIKRFTAETMREAIRNVRETWGPDAVILSNKKLGNGVEITAAIILRKRKWRSWPPRWRALPLL
ncbi:MAG: flagellar biosynthesis protein FlhF, partial [Gammaproteobacteria bacterium]